MKKLFLALLFLFSPALLLAEEFPLTPANAKVDFQMDSTWHAFAGKAPVSSGMIIIDDLNNPTKVSGKVVISVLEMNTNNEMRDEKMHNESMESSRYPDIVYKITGYEEGKLFGNLTIMSVTKPVTLDLEVHRGKSAIEYVGTTVIQWKGYGVNDPSIFIATVHDDVAIKVSVTLPLK